MRIALASLALIAALPVAAQERSKPQPVPFVDTIPAARDALYPGTMTLKVDATDTARGIIKVSQTIPISTPGPLTLLFPKWLPGNHAPRGEIEKLVGLVIQVGGKPLVWKRDPVDVFAFHIDVPHGARALDISFAFASATEPDQGRIVVSADMLNLQWNSISLYPAGWFTRGIPVSATVTYPAEWQAGTALRAATTTGDTVKYETVDYETLIDSPVFAGRYFRREDLGQNVTLNIVADQPENLVATPDQIEVHRQLVDQAVKLFGAKHFDHYDFLLALTEQMGSIGLEHHRSSENGANPEYFTDWASGPGRRNLLAHEFTHSWNGKFRRPAELWTPDYRTPMRNSLLWLYEGQTQFWGYVLGARSGLFSKQDTLDALASIAANLDFRQGHEWRSLDDTTNDPIITARRPKAWVSYQRSEDYYSEGMMIWLEVDAIIRERSRGARSMDDFARAFFGQTDGDWGIKTYDFDEITRTLSQIEPYDWAGFLKKRLTEKGPRAPLDGLSRSGYKLVYTDTPTSFVKDADKRAKELNLSYSLGLSVNKDKQVNTVIWGGPAFAAGITNAAEMVAVDGVAYTDEIIKAAIIAAKGGTKPIRLTIKTGNQVRDVDLIWGGGLRYPRLEKVGTGVTGLDALLTARN